MAQGRPVVGNSMMLCPAAHCGHLMGLDSRAGYDVRTGLDYLHCRRCGHRGMRARDGVQLLFTGQHEYVFSYGPSLSCLKVVLSTVALNQFRVQGLTSVQLATHVAEWALLMGQVCGTVRPAGDLVLSRCYEYCRQQSLRTSSLSTL